MKDAQQEIKSTVTVNTSDIAAKAHEDKEQGRDLEKLAKKRGGEFSVRVFLLIVSSGHVWKRYMPLYYWRCLWEVILCTHFTVARSVACLYSCTVLPCFYVCIHWVTEGQVKVTFPASIMECFHYKLFLVSTAVRRNSRPQCIAKEN
jgi:hypothetical protein